MRKHWETGERTGSLYHCFRGCIEKGIKEEIEEAREALNEILEDEG